MADHHAVALSNAHLPRQALILAGGAGTRLQSVVSDVPKPMARVRGRPFLEYLVAQVVRAGVEEVVLLVGYLGDVIERHFGDGARFGVRISYSREREPLGTGGALKLAEAQLIGDRWLVLNGDSIFDISLGELIARHIDHPAAATLALAHVPDSSRYGSVTVAADGTVTAFVEKSDTAAPDRINGGLYMIERSVLQRIPVDRPASFEREVLPQLVGRGLRGEQFDGYFIDIGVPADYARAGADAYVFDRLVSDLR
jgi:D-glycero-alpha-D-manno-heptose 1-phosphate guanylyltransferase